MTHLQVTPPQRGRWPVARSALVGGALVYISRAFARPSGSRPRPTADRACGLLKSRILRAARHEARAPARRRDSKSFTVSRQGQRPRSKAPLPPTLPNPAPVPPLRRSPCALPRPRARATAPTHPWRTRGPVWPGCVAGKRRACVARGSVHRPGALRRKGCAPAGRPTPDDHALRRHPPTRLPPETGTGVPCGPGRVTPIRVAPLAKGPSTPPTPEGMHTASCLSVGCAQYGGGWVGAD